MCANMHVHTHTHTHTQTLTHFVQDQQVARGQREASQLQVRLGFAIVHVSSIISHPPVHAERKSCCRKQVASAKQGIY